MLLHCDWINYMGMECRNATVVQCLWKGIIIFLGLFSCLEQIESKYSRSQRRKSAKGKPLAMSQPMATTRRTGKSMSNL